MNQYIVDAKGVLRDPSGKRALKNQRGSLKRIFSKMRGLRSDYREFTALNAQIAEQLRPFKDEIEKFQDELKKAACMPGESARYDGGQQAISFRVEIPLEVHLASERIPTQALSVYEQNNEKVEAANRFYKPTSNLLRDICVATLGLAVVIPAVVYSSGSALSDTVFSVIIVGAGAIAVSSLVLQGKLDKQKEPWKDAWDQVVSAKGTEPAEFLKRQLVETVLTIRYQRL